MWSSSPEGLRTGTVSASGVSLGASWPSVTSCLGPSVQPSFLQSLMQVPSFSLCFSLPVHVSQHGDCVPPERTIPSSCILRHSVIYAPFCRAEFYPYCTPCSCAVVLALLVLYCSGVGVGSAMPLPCVDGARHLAHFFLFMCADVP